MPQLKDGPELGVTTPSEVKEYPSLPEKDRDKQEKPPRAPKPSPEFILAHRDPRDTFNRQLAKRATAIDSRLTRWHPKLAADLVLSAAPTRQLPGASTAIVEADIALHQRYGDFVPTAMVVQNNPNPDITNEERNAALTVIERLRYADPDAAEAVQAALKRGDEFGLSQVVSLALGIEDAGFDEQLQIRADAQTFAHVVMDTASHGDEMLAWAQTLVNAPALPFQAGANVGGKVLRAVGAEGIADQAGSAAQLAERTFGRGVRVGEAVIAAPVSIASAAFSDEQGVGENLHALAHSAWDVESEHGPVGTTLIQLGVDEDSTVLDWADLGGDTVVAYLLAKGAASLKLARATPLESGSVGRFRFLQTSVEDWATSRKGSAVLGDVVRTNLADPDVSAGALIKRYRINTDLAVKLSSARTITEARRALIDHVVDHPTQKRLNGLHAERRKISERLVDGAEDADQLVARQAQIDAKLADYARYQPVDTWPRRSSLARFVDKVPGQGSLRTLVSSLYRRTGVSPDKLANDLPTKPRIVNPVDAAPAQMADNVRIINDYLKLARTPDEFTTRVLNDFATIKTRQHFFEWYRDRFVPAVEEGLSRGGDDLDHLTARELGSSIRRGDLEATRSPINIETTRADGVLSSELTNVLEDADSHHPLPTQPNEMVGDIVLPDVDLVRQAARTILNGDKLPSSLRPGYEGARWYASLPFRVGTAIGKPLVLLGVPRLILRATIFEQSLRNIFYGQKPLALLKRITGKAELAPGGVLVRKGFGIRELLPDEDPNVLGTLLRDEFEPGETVYVRVRTDDFGPTGMASAADRTAVGRSLAEQVQHLADDDLAKMVARDGAEATLRYLEDHPETDLGRFYRDDMPPILQRAGVDAAEWLRRKEFQIDELTGGDPALREAVWSGRVERGRVIDPVPRADLLDDISDIDGAIVEAKVGGDSVKVMELRRRKTEVVDSLKPGRVTSFEVGDTGRLAHEILDSETYTLPKEVIVKRTAKVADVQGARAKFDEALSKTSKALYKPLKLWGRADVALTRGSMFFQELARYEKRLLDLGYPKRQAFEIAQYRAAFITRDRMYDLAARSSFDRATKHIFWFAPAAREIATTWFVKIPSRSYWPVGMAHLLFQGKVTLDTLQETGIIRTRELGNGEEKHFLVLPSPFSDESIEVSLDSFVSLFPIGGNPVTLTPMAQLTGEHIPALKGITRWLSFSDEVSFFPGWLKKSWELATGERFPADALSREAEDRAITIARDKALQLAASELIQRGDVMPMPSDFQSEQQYRQARDAWLKRLNAEADTLHTGTALTQLFGMVVGPVTLTQTTPERLAYEDWKNAQGIEFPYSDEDYDKIDAYVLQHPEAAPFTISYWENDADSPDVPEDADFWTKVEAGELIAADPKDYALELQARTSMAYAYRLQARDLRRAGFGNDLTLEETLRRSGDYDRVMDAHQRRLDEYFALNPEVEVWWKKHEEKLAELYGEPILTAEQENFHQLYRLLDENSSYFLGAGGQAAEGMGELQAKIRERMAAFPEPTTQLGKQRAWWFDNVLGPYLDEVGPLYDRAETLREAGKDASAIYDRIRNIADEYGPVDKYGQNLPGAEEYLYGLKTDRAKASTVAGWATRPPTWLTDFQLTETYGNRFDFPKRDEALRYVRLIDDNFYEAYGRATTDAQKESLNRQRAQMLGQVARYYGEPAGKMINLLDAPPAVRLSTAGFGQGNADWKWATTKALSIAQDIERKGYNPAYDSEYALKLKTPFLKELERRRLQHPAFDALWNTLSFAIPERGYDQRRDVPLYVAILFNQFGGTYYDPETLINAVERNQ